MADVDRTGITIVEVAEASGSSNTDPLCLPSILIESSSGYASPISVCSDEGGNYERPSDLLSQRKFLQEAVSASASCTTAVQKVGKSSSLNDMVLCEGKQVNSMGDRCRGCSLTTCNRDALDENPDTAINTDILSLGEISEISFVTDDLAPMETLSVSGCLAAVHVRENELAIRHQPMSKTSPLFKEQRGLVHSSMPELQQHAVCDQPQGLPRSTSVVSRLSTISQRFLQRWSSSRFHRTMRRRGKCNGRSQDAPMVTAYAMAEDYLSLSIILCIVCVPVNPLCIFFVTPTVVLSSMVYCEQRKGMLRSDDVRLDIVSLLLCIVLIGGAIATLLTATIVTVVCVCT